MPEKSAEEWIKRLGDVSTLGSEYSDSIHIDDIRKIQRNAKHAAMLEAAKVAKLAESEGCMKIADPKFKWPSKAILTAAKKYED